MKGNTSKKTGNQKSQVSMFINRLEKPPVSDKQCQKLSKTTGLYFSKLACRMQIIGYSPKFN